MLPRTPAQRRLRNRADARRSILDAAEELLVEGGLEGFSMRRLAERCGSTAPTIYHYFKDKQRLVETLLEERLEGLVAELRAVEPSDDPVATVHSLAAAFAGFGIRNPSHYALLVMQRGEDAPEPASSEEVRRIFGAPLEALVRAGELGERDLEPLRQGLWSLLHGFILLQTTRPEDAWEPDLLDRSLAAMIRGSLEAGAGAGRAKRGRRT
jgi:AcrR family transcriptional regulator